MSTIYKTVEHSPNEDAYIYHQTSSDIVDYDSSNSENLDADNIQDAVETINDKVEDRVTIEAMNETVEELTTDIENINRKAEGKANTVTLYTTIFTSGFDRNSSKPYSQTISVPGILETDNPIIGILKSESYEAAVEQRDAWGTISRITCGNDEITVYCYEEIPTIDLKIQIKVIR